MRVLLYEQWHGGHHDNYLRVLAPAVASLGVELVIAGSSRTYASIAATLSGLERMSLASPLPAVNPGLAIRDRLAASANLTRCIEAVRPDLTMLPSADAQAMGLAWLSLTTPRRLRHLGPIETTFHYGYGESATTIKERAKELVYTTTYRLLPSAAVNFVNFAYFEYARARGLVPDARLRLVGDPVPPPTELDRRSAKLGLGLDPDRRYIGMVGSLDRRKAIPLLIAAFAGANLRSTDSLLLAGRLDPSFRTLIDRDHADLVRKGRLVIMDRFLADDEVQLGYRALSVASLIYDSYPGLASLALKAVAAGTPLLVHDYGWARALVRRFEVGETVNAFDTHALADAMRSLLDRSEIGTSQSPAVARLLRFHAESNFAGLMTAGLRSMLGLPPSALVGWDDVLAAVPPEKRHLI